jgi:hypothetical protein
MAKLSDLLSEERSGGMEPLEKGVSRFLTEVVAELKHQAKMGAHELSAALLRDHDGFVMYQRDGVDDPKIEAPVTPEAKGPEIER